MITYHDEVVKNLKKSFDRDWKRLSGASMQNLKR